MERVVRAFPVLEGKRDQLERFLQELTTTRDQETSAFYRKYGVVRESAFLQKTAHGEILIVVTDLDAVEAAFSTYGASQEKFEAWFKECVREFSGIDLNADPRGPHAQCLLDWKVEESNGGHVPKTLHDR